ncbi:thioredoxin [Pelagibacteraceae bacterium]|nr:thioredoxin [Pelagibacteraceae bacterium]
MPALKVTDENFDSTIDNNEKPVLIKFGAEWCGPCKMVGPILDELSEEMSDQIVIGDHDIDHSPNAPTKFGVRGVPTMLLFKAGEVVDSKVGAASKEDIKTWINSKVG